MINILGGLTAYCFFPVPTNATCNTHIGKLVEKAEIITEQKVTFHTARHTFGTMFFDGGRTA